MWKRVIAGFGGAVALNVLHNFMRKNFDNVPEFHKLKHEVVNKSLDKVNLQVKDAERLHRGSFAGDILSNTLFYTITPFKMNSLVGMLGGVGAILLPKKLGLDNSPIAGNDKKKIMTVGYYVFGALVASGIYGMITCKKK